jgi:aspartyl aminopeptidase
VGFATRFLKFCNASPSAFHATNNVKSRLLEAGYEEIRESNSWEDAVLPGRKLFFTRNASTAVAFTVGPKFQPGEGGFKILGAHTDSPCLKLKPISKVSGSGYDGVGVQCYGGGQWKTWFDRDLGVAGRVIIKGERDGQLLQRFVNVDRPILHIPTLAIHLESAEERSAFKFNTETHLTPILSMAVKEKLDSKGDGPLADESGNDKGGINSEGNHHPLLLRLISESLDCAPSDILDFELSCHDTQPGQTVGGANEFISSPRLDNLVSVFCGLEAMLSPECVASESDEADIRMCVFFDNEEVGSQTFMGADSNMLEECCRRIHSMLEKASGGEVASDSFQMAMRRSFIMSADMAHAVHPNYPSKHQAQHTPLINAGPVLKLNANQRYATDAVGSALMRQLAQSAGVPMQEFVVRNDSPCGSTIGPILAAKTGLRAVDIGVPQLGMHSIREMCGVDDLHLFQRFIRAFFNDISADSTRDLA